MLKQKLTLAMVLGASAFALSACDVNQNLVAIGQDRGFDSDSLSQMQAAIYVDPDGCHIWMIDDGFEGYWSRRRDPVSGLPVCVPIAPTNSIVGEYDASSFFPDFTPLF